MIFWWHSAIPNPNCDLGARACEFFFVCAGFLTFYNHSKEPVNCTYLSSFTFLRKKLIKMYPLHFLMFIAVLFLNILKQIPITQVSIWEAILNLLCVQAWSPFVPVAMSFNGVSWFLSAILFCYFLSPAVVAFLKAQKKNAFIMGILVLLVRFWIEYISKNYPEEVFFFQIHVNPFVRFLEFFIGAIAAKLFLIRTKRKISFKLATVIEMVVLVWLIFSMITMGSFAYRAYYVGCFTVVVFVFAYNSGALSKLFSAKCLAHIGNIQFEIFMIHSVVIKYCRAAFSVLNIESWVAEALLSIVVTVVCAIIYKKLISQHIDSIIAQIINRNLQKVD